MKAAGSDLSAVTSTGLIGWCRWAGYQAVGFVLAVPIAIELLFKLITKPRSTLYRKDRNTVVFPDPLPDLTHEWIEAAPGIKLHAVRTSKGSSKPLMLMVHGFPEAWFSWRHQMAAFRDEYEVVAIEMRGYGESSRPQGRAAYRLPSLVADVTAVAQQLLEESGQEQLVLAGHDWGAYVCWCTAAASPHLLSKLAILCVPYPLCFFPNMDWDQFCRSWYIFAFQMPWLPEWYCSAGDYAMLEAVLTRPPTGCTTPGAVTPEYVERYKQAFGRPGAPTALINYYRSLIDLASRYKAPALDRALKGRRLQVPTLVMWGEQDHALGQQLLRGTEKYVDSLRVEVLAGCSHWAQQDRPAEVNKLLADFLRH